MENDKIKKNGFPKAIIILIILIVIVLGVGVAFARYITRLNGAITADIAQWSFKVNDKTNESFTIDLADTRIKANDEVQMQDGYIGPGTSGAFDIRLDATGSEVSLKYDVNIDVDNANNTKLPKNLIFYSDSTMQNAIYHENNIINLNGFIGVADNSKVHTKTVYWKWAYETGQTQNEISTNDVLDSNWMGEDISIAINVIGKQVNENPTTEEYTVTFDANGGTIQGYGNASQASKQVTYGGTYGDLPTPTREGYTFMGWNGKNLIDYKKSQLTYATISEDKIVLDSSQISGNEGTQSIQVWENFSTKWLKSSSNTGKFEVAFEKNNDFNKIRIKIDSTKSDADIYLDVSNLENGRKYSLSFNIDSIEQSIPRAVISEIQIEEGSTATAYEPYYITSSTEVVQNNSHTLKAIWVEN